MGKTFIDDCRYGDGQPEGMTVREVLTAAYGDAWDKPNGASCIDSVATVEDTYRTDGPVLVFRLAMKNECHGYDDTVSVANYNVLADDWANVEGLFTGTWFNVDSIGLRLDEVAPCNLIDVIESLENYPLLSDDEHSQVEQNMITEHWELYGRMDTLSAVADALELDSRSDLTDYASEVVDTLTFGGYLPLSDCGGEYPTVIDCSAVEFGSKAVAAYIAGNYGQTVTLSRGSWDTLTVTLTLTASALLA